MRRRLAAFAIVFFVSNAAIAAEPIGQVKSYSDLLAVKPVTIDGKWEVKLGWSESGAMGGPWVLVFAQAKYMGEGAPPPIHGPIRHELLGPVGIRVRKGEERIADQMSELDNPALPRAGLYCATIPVAWKGSYTIEILDSKEQMIARTTVEIKEPRECLWHSFAEAVRHGAALDSRVLAKSEAIFPVIDSAWSLLPADDSRKYADSLPDIVPVADEWLPLSAKHSKKGDEGQALNLALKEGRFEVSSVVDMLDWPDLTLAARWWVNGKPIPASLRMPTAEHHDGGRQIWKSRKASIVFGYPIALNAKPGDAVSVQLMYVPNQTVLVEESADFQVMKSYEVAGDRMGSPFPVLSNKLGFTLTDELVKLREQNAK